jgi:hypothetical protein
MRVLGSQSLNSGTECDKGGKHADGHDQILEKLHCRILA